MSVSDDLFLLGETKSIKAELAKVKNLVIENMNTLNLVINGLAIQRKRRCIVVSKEYDARINDYKEVKQQCVFHSYGLSHDGAGNLVSVAIVEGVRSGEILEVPPRHVRFDKKEAAEKEGDPDSPNRQQQKH
jgi:hypothetical protein